MRKSGKIDRTGRKIEIIKNERRQNARKTEDKKGRKKEIRK